MAGPVIDFEFVNEALGFILLSVAVATEEHDLILPCLDRVSINTRRDAANLDRLPWAGAIFIVISFNRIEEGWSFYFFFTAFPAAKDVDEPILET